MSSVLERRYRRLLRVLPGWYRRDRADEMVATLLAGREDRLGRGPGAAESMAVWCVGAGGGWGGGRGGPGDVVGGCRAVGDSGVAVRFWVLAGLTVVLTVLVVVLVVALGSIGVRRCRVGAGLRLR